MSRKRPPRSQHEIEAGRIYARRRQRRLLGWPPERWDDPPAPRSARAPRPAEPLEPVPDLDPHPLVHEALAELRAWERSDFERGMDAIARDLVGAYVLAALEGADPQEALRLERARYRHDRAALVYGTALATGLER